MPAEPLPDVALPGRTPHTPMAVNIEMWFDGGFAERIEQAAALGFPAIEFWFYDDRDIDAGIEVLKRHGLIATQFTAWGFGREINHPEFPADRFVAKIEESCDMADRLPGCDLFTVVGGDNVPDLSKEEMHRAIVAKLKAAAPLLEERGKTIILEPMNPWSHPDHCLYGSADGIAICEAVGSENVKLNWDLFHMQRYEGNLITRLEEGRDWIGYVQFADSPDRCEPRTGEVRWEAVFKKVREIGYTRPVGIECYPLGGEVLRAAQRIHRMDFLSGEWCYPSGDETIHCGNPVPGEK